MNSPMDVEEIVVQETTPPEAILSASEALYAFMGWLTSREEQVCFSGKDNATPAVELIGQFCKHNNLPEPREGWTDLYSLPKIEEVKQ